MPIRKTARNAAIIMGLLAQLAPSVWATTSRSLLGSWAGEVDGDRINILLWFDQDSVSNAIVRGFVVNDSEQCGVALIGERVMSAATTFLGRVADKRYTEFALEFELRTTDLEDLPICSPFGPLLRFALGYDPDTAEASLAAMGNPGSVDEVGFSRLEFVTNLRRQSPSAIAQRVLALNPAIDRELGNSRPPGAGVAALIADSTLEPETIIAANEIPCRAQARDEQVRMQQMGIASLAGSLESADLVGVRYDQYEGPLPAGVWSEAFRASRSEQYRQLRVSGVAEPDFLEMAGQVRLGDDACKQARAVGQFLAMLEMGQTGESVAAEPLPRIADANGMYFFDDAGIEIVTGERMRRVYGSTTLFRPGDLSRTSRWNAEGQSMRTRAMVKHSITGEIEEDLLSLPNDARFFYDRELSERYGGDIWTTGSESRQGDCQKWQARHFIDNCIERAAPDAYSLHRYYLASDLSVATSLFHVISPDAQTEFNDGLLDPARGCDDGPFCGLPGGLYIDAIFRGDFALIEDLEVEFFAAQDYAYEALGERIGGESEFFRRMGQTIANFVAVFDFSPLPRFANVYMYQYQDHPPACFDQYAKRIPKETFVPAIVIPGSFDFAGNFTEAEVFLDAHIETAEYRLNPKFFELCDLLCDTSKPSSRGFFVGDAHRRLTQGFERVLSDYACDSPDVQQFEDNLIDLTFAMLRRGPPAPDPGFVERSSL